MVYIVYMEWHVISFGDGKKTCGVFSTEEKASGFIDEIMKEAHKFVGFQKREIACGIAFEGNDGQYVKCRYVKEIVL